MRIVITSPPKTGNKWLKCLLGSIYDLDMLLGDDTPATNATAVKEWVASGGCPDGWIFHQHCRYTLPLVDTFEAIPAHLVTIIRDPYDQFVSLYYWLQTRSVRDQSKHKVRPKERPRNTLVGKPLDHPDVLAYLGDGFRDYLVKANDWLHGGRSVVVRYEDLHRDPVAALTAMTDQIKPVAPARIVRAINTCTAENMRKASKSMATHVRSAKVGDSRERLSEVQLAIFRDKHADLIESLGYEVR